MDASKDYYAILGVVPSAEPVVIRAAYRALAQRYHPDRFSGSAEEAHRRMSEINEAYQVLSEPAKRAEYNKLRGSGTQSGDTTFGDTADEPPPNQDPLAADWELACEYYPDLIEITKRLSKFSWRLAAAYKAFLVEEQAFEERKIAARNLENEFLTTYFGNSEPILEFARELFLSGQKQAARELNKAIKVFGSTADPDRVISSIRRKFDLGQSSTRTHSRSESEPTNQSERKTRQSWSSGNRAVAIFLVVVSVLGIVLFTGISKDPLNRTDPADAQAQFELGLKYKKGEGVPQSNAEAVRWWRKAAEGGLAQAQAVLGFAYELGDHVPQSDSEAARWFRKAAEQGHPEAQTFLAEKYATGKGVPHSDFEAVRWWRKAAAQGERLAWYSLGVCYYEGEGVPQSNAEAVRWWRKAAEGGVDEAQYMLGLMYALGRGVSQDLAEARKWLRKAASQGHVDARVRLEGFERAGIR